MVASVIRVSADGSITMVQDDDGRFHVPSQWEMDHLDVGEDLEDWEIEALDP